MTDYCECGTVATHLCKRCKTPTCRFDFVTHPTGPHRIGAIVDLGQSARLNIEGFAREDVALCIGCLTKQAEIDLDRSLRPALSASNLNDFERSCALNRHQWDRGRISYLFTTWKHSERYTQPRLPEPVLNWEMRDGCAGASGDSYSTIAGFAIEFAEAARKRNVAPVRIKLSRFHRVDGWEVPRDASIEPTGTFEYRSVDQYNRFRPLFVIASDGSKMWRNHSYTADVNWSRLDSDASSSPRDPYSDDNYFVWAAHFLDLSFFVA